MSTKFWLRRAARLAVCGVAVAVLSLGAVQAADPSVTPVPGKPSFLLGSFEAKDIGYELNEFFVSGDAVSYTSDGPPPEDGRWTVKPDGTAPYKTRILVLRPADPHKFNGTVVVEWLNVSGGVNAGADWFMAHREMVRSGMAYVGVSAQKVGVEGGQNMGGADNSLKKTDPARYGSLSHPGDAFSYDIYSQAGRLVRASGPGRILGPLTAKHVIAMGESQSAAYMTTYVNAIDPVAKVYDGFLIHSRSSGASPLVPGGDPAGRPQKIKIRPDLRVPVMTFITETDFAGVRPPAPGYYAAQQADTDHLRIWEVPGTSHADNYTVQVALVDTGSAPLEKLAAAYAPTNSLMGVQLPKTINFAPQHHYVLEAALAGLDRWIRTGQAPSKAPRIELTDSNPPTVARDDNGLAKGGIRTPWVDVPAARLSSVPAGNAAANPFAVLFGSSEPFDAATLAKLYPGGKAEYLKRFETSLDSAIKAGFILPADRKEILGLAPLMYPEAH